MVATVHRLRLAGALALAAMLVLAGSAAAAVPTGLQNGGFEASPEFDGWTAQIVHEGTYGEPLGTEPATCAPPRGACIVGDDTFTPTSGGLTPIPANPITVSPLDGSKMARLGGPFTSNAEPQALEHYVLSQTFVVDPANPVLVLNYNVFTFDYQGFDELRFDVTLTDESGTLITAVTQGAFGPGGDTSLKNTGWRSANIDLTGYENEQVHLSIDSGGTSDNLFGFWSYIDAGTAPVSPVAPPTIAPPTNPVTNQPVPLNVFDGGASNQTFIAIPASQATQFPGGCMPLSVSVPIDGAGGTVSDVSLILSPLNGTGQQTFAMSDPDGDGNWTGTIACAQTGDLLVRYTLTEPAGSQTFIVPIGGLTLIDPAGIVYDKAQYDVAIAAGSTPEQARATAAVSGAIVRLQRKVAGVFTNVLAGDPGIAPHINPETTGANGQYQWDVAAGSYRVVVSKDGYEVAMSEQIDVPPPRTDVHIGLVRATAPVPADGDGDGVPDSSDKCPTQAASTANGCPVGSAATPRPGPIAGVGNRGSATATGKTSVTGATKSVRVSKTGRFTLRFRTTPSASGTVQLKSAKAVRIGAAKRTISLGTKRFAASAAGRVAVKVRLSSTSLRALIRSKQLRFLARVTIGGQTFVLRVTLRAPRPS